MVGESEREKDLNFARELAGGGQEDENGGTWHVLGWMEENKDEKEKNDGKSGRVCRGCVNVVGWRWPWSSATGEPGCRDEAWRDDVVVGEEITECFWGLVLRLKRTAAIVSKCSEVRVWLTSRICFARVRRMAMCVPPVVAVVVVTGVEMVCAVV